MESDNQTKSFNISCHMILKIILLIIILVLLFSLIKDYFMKKDIIKLDLSTNST